MLFESVIMSEVAPVGKRFRDSLKPHVVKLAGLGASGMALAAPVAAEVDINASVYPILQSMIELIPTIIELVVAVVPAIIVLAVVGFIVGFFDKILSMMKL